MNVYCLVKTLLKYIKHILQWEVELEGAGKFGRTMNQAQQASN